MGERSSPKNLMKIFADQVHDIINLMIRGISEIKIENPTDVSEKLRLNIRLEVSDGHPTPQKITALFPHFNVIHVTYRCDVCFKDFEKPENLTNHQCPQCLHYFDTCPNCQPSPNGCYICQPKTDQGDPK